MQFLFYYSRLLYGSKPGDLLSYPRRVDFSSLPPLYQAVLSARVAVGGSFFALADTLVVASSSVRTPISSVSTMSTYSLLLEFHRREPACVRSFCRVFVCLRRGFSPFINLTGVQRWWPPIKAIKLSGCYCP